MLWMEQPTPFSYPVFIVWKITYKNEKPLQKGRVVVDIRGLNKITLTDSYPLPLQLDITAAVIGCMNISTMNGTGFFNQFKVQESDHHKLTFISHCGQEQLNVVVMGFKNSPFYVQRIINEMLRLFKDFTKVYIDDIIIFSRSDDEHLNHLNQVMNLLDGKGVTLKGLKSFLNYPLVLLLGQ